MSQAISTLTATAATNGDATATMPRTISDTPHKIDRVEACRTNSAGVCNDIGTSLDQTFSSLNFLRWRSVDHRVHEYKAMKMSRGRMGRILCLSPLCSQPAVALQTVSLGRDKVPRAEFPPERELCRDAHS